MVDDVSHHRERTQQHCPKALEFLKVSVMLLQSLTAWQCDSSSAPGWALFQSALNLLSQLSAGILWAPSVKRVQQGPWLRMVYWHVYYIVYSLSLLYCTCIVLLNNLILLYYFINTVLFQAIFSYITVIVACKSFFLLHFIISIVSMYWSQILDECLFRQAFDLFIFGIVFIVFKLLL